MARLPRQSWHTDTSEVGNGVIESLPPELRIALALTPPPEREALRAVLLLDARLGTIVLRSREPLLAQVRFAWWRERLAEAPELWPSGEPVLDSFTKHWRAMTTPLVPLVNGWEDLLGGAPLTDPAIARFAAGRGRALGAFAERAGCAADEARQAGERWGFAEFACRTSNHDERSAALRLGSAMTRPYRLPRVLRGVALLDGLSARAIARREPLFAGRRAALAAMRLGIFGR